MNADEKRKIEDYKQKIINQHKPDEIQKMADNAIFHLNKEIKKKKAPFYLVKIFKECITLLEKDSISGLALMDAIGDMATEELEKVKNENNNLYAS